MGICGSTNNTKKEDSNKPGIIFVVGGPGSGKGTQCTNLVKKYKFEHLSTGDLLREEVASGSEKGTELQQIMKDGGLVPTKDLLGLLEAAMQKRGWASKKFLIDGFPRNEENVTCFADELHAKTNLHGVLFFDLDGETMRSRCLGRGAGRSDDNEETIKKRLATYDNETVPVIEKMVKNGNVYKVDSSKSKDEVFACTVLQVDAMIAGKPPCKEGTEEVEVFPETPAGDKPWILFVVGGPGSGKGTHCAKLVEKYFFEHLSTGDLLREEVASGSIKGEKLQKIMKEGGFVQTKDLLGLLKAAMIKKGWGSKKFLLDGFPRNQENIDTFNT